MEYGRFRYKWHVIMDKNRLFVFLRTFSGHVMIVKFVRSDVLTFPPSFKEFCWNAVDNSPDWLNGYLGNSNLYGTFLVVLKDRWTSIKQFIPNRHGFKLYPDRIRIECPEVITIGHYNGKVIKVLIESKWDECERIKN